MSTSEQSDSLARQRREAFNQILAEREQALLGRKGKAEKEFDPPKSAEHHGFQFTDNRIGLALSGGGIRSASFNLGLVQYLVKIGLFSKLDYLSTVSGGSYIGAMISAHAGSPPASGKGRGFPQDPHATDFDPELLRHIRENVRYLTPSATGRVKDIIVFCLAILRGVLAHLVLGFLLIGLIALPWTLSIREWVDGKLAGLGAWTIGTAGIILVISCFNVLLGFRVPIRAERRDWLHVLLMGMVFLFLFEVAILIHNTVAGPHGHTFERWTTWIAAASSLGGMVGPYAVILKSNRKSFSHLSKMPRVILRIAPFLILLGLGHLSFKAYDRGILTLIDGYPQVVTPKNDLNSPATSNLAKTRKESVLQKGTNHIDLGYRIVLASFVVLHLIFVLSPRIYKSKGKGVRTWWLEVLAEVYLLLVLLLWYEIPKALTIVLMSLGLIAILLCCLGIEVSRQRAAPILMSLGLIGFLILPMISLSQYTVGEDCFSGTKGAYWYLYFLLLPCAWVFCLTFDLNITSLHSFYRDRLSALFLTDPVTGAALSELPIATMSENVTERGMPYHLIQCTVNLPRNFDRQLAERQADGFMISGESVGSPSTLPIDRKGAIERNVPTGKVFGVVEKDLNLSWAMAVSGAAVNSFQGRDLPPSTSALMTALNLRLGYWSPNPALVSTEERARVWDERTMWPGYFVKELISTFNQQDARCLLSDGGHFENLGLYELVRRKCRYIIVSDASADPERSFSDLGNAIRKCRIDHDCSITLDLSSLQPDPNTGYSMRHAVVGELNYSGGARGILVYVKSSLTGDEPPDVIQYRGDHPSFPHESTVDQFFDEAQFESYRHLGNHIGTTIFNARFADQTPDQFFRQLRDNWRSPLPPSPVPAQGAAELGESLLNLEQAALLQQLNTLDRTQFPEFFPDAARPGADLSNAEFHQIRSQLKLMETVWASLGFDELRIREHPDYRGWMNLFRRWSQSPQFKRSYRVLRSLHGTRFERFCEIALNMPGNDQCYQTDFLESKGPGGSNLPREIIHQCGRILYEDPLWPSLIRRWRVTLRKMRKGSVGMHLVRLSAPFSRVLGFAVVHDAADGHPGCREVSCVMTDSRFYFSNISDLLAASFKAHQGEADLFILPPLNKAAQVVASQWERMYSYFPLFGFTPRYLPKESAKDALVERAVRARLQEEGADWGHARTPIPYFVMARTGNAQAKPAPAPEDGSAPA